jgi:hypothetical protein
MKRPLILSLALSLMTLAACGGPQTISSVPHTPIAASQEGQATSADMIASGQITIEPGQRPGLRFQVTYSPQQFRTQALDCSRLASFKIYVDGISMEPMHADNASGEHNTVTGGSCTITARISDVPSGRSRVAHVIPYDSAGNPQTDLALSAAFDLTNPAENPKAVYLNFRSTPVGQIIQQLLDTNQPLLASKTDIVDLQTLIDQVIGTTFDPGNPSIVLEDFTLIHPLLVNQNAILEDLQNNGANVEELLNLPPDQLLTLLEEYRLEPAQVSGTVTGLDSGDTITVRLLDPVTGAQTNVSNSFSFTDVPPGTWQLVVDAPPGYQVVSAPSTVTVTAGQTLDNLQIEVQPNTTPDDGDMDLQATAVTTQTADITWDESPGATGYNIYVDYVLVASVPGSSLSYQITGLDPATVYGVQVKATVGGVENGEQTDRIFVTTANDWNSWASVPGTSSLNVLAVDTDLDATDQVFFGAENNGASKCESISEAPLQCINTLKSGAPHNAGSVYAVAIEPRNAEIVYAGSSTAGVFKSEDNGQTWTQKNNGLSGTALDVRAILVDPVNPNIVYIGTRGSGVYRSTDRGETWSEFNTGIDPSHREVYSLAIYNPPAPANPIIYAGTRVGGVYRIQDSGWNTINVGIFDSGTVEEGTPYLAVVTVTALATHPTDASILYGGGLGSYIIYDVGVWRRIENGTPIADWRQIGGNGSNSFPCPTPLSLVPSYLGGCSPATPSTGLLNMKILGIAVDPITPTIIYAATEAGIFKSTTSGSSWSNSYASGVFSGRVNAIGTSPARLYIGSSTGLWRAGALEP